jgi:hypothetical protein
MFVGVKGSLIGRLNTEVGGWIEGYFCKPNTSALRTVNMNRITADPEYRSAAATKVLDDPLTNGS